jgi:undecaprenyl-diphosphatase
MFSMSLLQSLIEIDKDLLLTINSNHTPLLDNFYFLVTQITIWIPLYLTMIYIIIKSQKRGSWVTLLFIAILIVLCDQISTNILKDSIQRFRPSNDPALKDIVHIFANNRGGLYGFVSSHAANTFGLAMFTSLLFKNKFYTAAIFLWATLNSYSRIYLGLHFPGDILGGMLLGISLSLIVYFFYLKVYPYFVIFPTTLKKHCEKRWPLRLKIITQKC